MASEQNEQSVPPVPRGSREQQNVNSPGALPSLETSSTIEGSPAQQNVNSPGASPSPPTFQHIIEYETRFSATGNVMLSPMNRTTRNDVNSDNHFSFVGIVGFFLLYLIALAVVLEAITTP